MSTDARIYRIKKAEKYICYCVEKRQQEPQLLTLNLKSICNFENALSKFCFRSHFQIRPFIFAPSVYFDTYALLRQSSLERRFHPVCHISEFLNLVYQFSVLLNLVDEDIYPIYYASSIYLRHIPPQNMFREKGVDFCNEGGDFDGDDALSEQFYMAVSLRNHVRSDNIQKTMNGSMVPIAVPDDQKSLSSSDGGFQEEQQMSIFTSSSLSHSPSPVRSPIASPFAAATIKPPGYSLIGHSPSESVPTPFDSDVCNSPRNSICQVARRRAVDCNDFKSRNTQPIDSYPEHLNPFSHCEDKFTYNLRLSKNGLESASVVTPFDALTDPCDGVNERPKSSAYLPIHGNECHTSVKNTCSCKRQAPPRPPKPDVETLRNFEFRKRLSELDSNAPSNSIERSHSCKVSRRFSSTEPRLKTNLHTACHSETKSVIMKRQAPPIPVPNKRIIKADPDDRFIGYGELHQQLQEIHHKLTDTEQSSRKIQTLLKRGSAKRLNVDLLLEEWTKLADVKDSLLKQEAQLLKRLHRQELEERHANVEHELRTLLAKQDALKTPEEKAREEELLKDLVHTVDKRAELVDQSLNGDSLTESSSNMKMPRRFTCLRVRRFGKKSRSLTKHFHIRSRSKTSSPSKSCVRSQSHND